MEKKAIKSAVSIFGIYFFVSMIIEREQSIVRVVVDSLVFTILFFPIYYLVGKNLIAKQKQTIVPKLKINTSDPLEKITEKCKDLGTIIKNSKIKNNDGNGNIIIAVGMGFKSFGEIITISITKNELENNEIVIKSRPIFKYTVVDYNKNYDNVKKIESYFKENINIDSCI